MGSFESVDSERQEDYLGLARARRCSCDLLASRAAARLLVPLRPCRTDTVRLGEAADFLATFVAPFAFVALSALGFVSIRQRPAPEDGPLDGTAGVVAALGLVTGIWCGLFLILILMPIAD